MASEHDACALVAIARKDARPTRAVLELVLHGMASLAHRSGVVDGEGDGAGVLTDIPRALWAHELDLAGRDETAVELERFAVGHFFHADPADVATIVAILAGRGIETLLVRAETTDEAALGPRERTTGATVVSLSRHTAVYKLRGSGHQLASYFADLGDPRFATSAAFGHNRYATNTTTSFTRVQPFPVFAHNGEINTISRLREEARALGLPLSRDGSDSQDVDAAIRALVIRHGLTAVESIELLFPPIVNEMKRMTAELQDAYVQGRAAIGPLAQGPAGILVRVGDTCVFGVDALGLRPLWHVETEEEHVFASERGFVPLESYITDPVPLGPGERVALRRDRGWRLLDQGAVRERFLAARRLRGVSLSGLRSHLTCGGPAEPIGAAKRWEIGTPPDEMDDVSVRRERQFAALGFEPDDLKMAAFMIETGNEPIGSLGYDGPLAALAPRANLADHLHETVAVVTNPAIDREREIEHFSTRVLLGPRPAPHAHDSRRWIELATPLLLGGHPAWTGLRSDDFRTLARQKGTWLLDDVVARFAADGKIAPVFLEADRDWEEHPRDALARLGAAAARGVRAGAQLVVIRDHGVMGEGRAWLDPHLVIAAAHRALVAQPSLRRDCALVVSAGSIRNLHDVMVALALGADAVNPYLLLEYAIATADPDALGNLIEALRKGIEKVMSTLGIHELRGYGRQLSAVGVAPEVARFAGLETFCATDEVGLGWERIAEEGFARASMLRERRDARLEPAFRIWPRAWKSALAVANGEAPYATYAEKLRELETLHPVSLRHLLDFVRPGAASPPPAEPPSTATSAGEHAGPFYISSMSFGSQGETAYRAYAEAMARLDLLCINGEGGELPDLIGRYPRNRGQQIASGRFGVSALLANSSNYLEIKIGQGAKPGEGGHLPARKVSKKVALARNAQPGIDLISPSNNHDIYSIEDLAQVVHELKTVNPRARVSVKVPVVPDIGVIAVGIAKAGADIVTLSGYDGGTGAARQHA
ncbi:MAG: glutamate synthase, partial [Chloroflexi bacterium]